MAPPIAVQLYTLRDEMEQDFEGTLRQVADLGYAGVELAGRGGRTPTQLRHLLDGLGLKVASAHVPIQDLESNLDREIEAAQTLGSRFIAIPWLPPERRTSAEDFAKLGEQLNSIGAACKQAGIQLCYHNHDFEFQQFDGVYALDKLYASTDPELLKAELDVYWVQYAGVDPVAYVAKYADRAPLIHLKDMTSDGTRFFAEVGEGIVDLEGVIAVATGAEWLVVEQDRSRRTPLESIAISISNLRKKGHVAS